MSYTCFDVSVQEQIANLVLSRPEAYNSMIPEFWRELPEIVRDLERTGETRVIVISSTGRHFTAGMDLSVFTSGAAEMNADPGRERANLRRDVLRLQETFCCLDRSRLPVLAAIQGGCIGGGLDLVCACDARYCTEDAFFCIQEVNLGMTADVGTFPRLAHLIPQGIARELAYTGRRLGAAEALQVGLVNRVFGSAEEMLESVRGTAREIAARSPLAVWGSKEMLNYARDHTIADGLDYIATWQSGMLQAADVMESLAAKSEKREPKYPDLLPLREKL